MSAAVFPAGRLGLARRPPGTGVIVEVRRDLAALRALAPDWEALAADAADPNPFYEPWLLLPALEAYGAGDELRFVAIWEDGRLGALLPMRLEKRWRGLPVPALRSWSHRNILLCCAPLVRARSAAKCLAALLASALAPVIEFDWLPAEGVFYGALAEAASAAGRPWAVTDAYTRAVLRREFDPRPRFTSNLRNNLRRCGERLAAHGRVTPVRLGAGDDATAWATQFMALEASGWKGRAGTALACREDDRRFTLQAFAEAHRRGRLTITGLDLDGRPLARHCMIGAGNGAFTYKIAYDERYEKCSPGLLAEVDNVRQFLENPGPRWVDSNTARENTSYGRVWKDRRTVQRVAVGLTPLGRLTVAAWPLGRFAKRLLARPAQ